jgi:MFS family permease
MASSSAALGEEDFEVARHLKRNYVAHSLEGGLFIGGVAFVHPQTVLPRIIERLGGPDWVIAAAPVLLMLGFFTPSLFITHRLERLSVLKPFVMAIGLLQRLPYLLVGSSLLLVPDPGDTVLTLVVLAPLLSGLAGGVSVTAWREYIAKSIPAHRRASLWAIRFVLGGVIGVLAGQLVSVVLNRYGETRAYALLHLAVFALMTLSYGMFALTREPNLDSTRAHASKSWWSYARAVRRIVLEDSHLRPYLGCRALFSGLYVVLPFLTLRALEVLRLPDAYLGRLLMFQMVGSVVGNLVGGYLGDRRGGKLVMLLSQGGSILVAVGATSLTSALAFELLFMALGLAFGLGGVGVPTLDFEMSNFAQRMSYQTVIGVSHLLGMIGAVLIAATVRQFSTNFNLLAWISAGMMLGSLLLLLRLPEPRGRRDALHASA